MSLCLFRVFIIINAFFIFYKMKKYYLVASFLMTTFAGISSPLCSLTDHNTSLKSGLPYVRGLLSNLHSLLRENRLFQSIFPSFPPSIFNISLIHFLMGIEGFEPSLFPFICYITTLLFSIHSKCSF